jgi:hypothetical protein
MVSYIWCILIVLQGVVGKAYRVQVSNDGENFSNAATMVVYSSKCANCSLDSQAQAHCTAKVTVIVE